MGVSSEQIRVSLWQLLEDAGYCPRACARSGSPVLKPMPQTFVALQCAFCNTFQGQLDKKSKKFSCVICNAKQSFRTIFAVSNSGKDIRLTVQQLNELRGAHEELKGSEVVQQIQHNLLSQAVRPAAPTTSEAPWDAFAEADGGQEQEEAWAGEEAGFVTSVPDAAKGRKQVHSKQPGEAPPLAQKRPKLNPTGSASNRVSTQLHVQHHQQQQPAVQQPRMYQQLAAQAGTHQVHPPIKHVPAYPQCDQQQTTQQRLPLQQLPPPGQQVLLKQPQWGATAGSSSAAASLASLKQQEAGGSAQWQQQRQQQLPAWQQQQQHGHADWGQPPPTKDAAHPGMASAQPDATAARATQHNALPGHVLTSRNISQVQAGAQPVQHQLRVQAGPERATQLVFTKQAQAAAAAAGGGWSAFVDEPDHAAGCSDDEADGGPCFVTDGDITAQWA